MYGKILITMTMKVLTGMHIGGSNGFSAIGSVDSPVVRDSWSGKPMVPASSLKGKMRYLLARSEVKDDCGYLAPSLDKESDALQRLFGTAGSKNRDPRGARLQFADCFIMKGQSLGPITEVKFENSIDRRTSVANPRQIERVVRGNCFKVTLVYNVENEAEVQADFRLIAKGLKLISLDYLGGHGSRGYGRVAFTDPDAELVSGDLSIDIGELVDMLKEVENYAVFDR